MITRAGQAAQAAAAPGQGRARGPSARRTTTATSACPARSAGRARSALAGISRPGHDVDRVAVQRGAQRRGAAAAAGQVDGSSRRWAGWSLPRAPAPPVTMSATPYCPPSDGRGLLHHGCSRPPPRPAAPPRRPGRRARYPGTRPDRLRRARPPRSCTAAVSQRRPPARQRQPRPAGRGRMPSSMRSPGISTAATSASPASGRQHGHARPAGSMAATHTPTDAGQQHHPAVQRDLPGHHRQPGPAAQPG